MYKRAALVNFTPKKHQEEGIRKTEENGGSILLDWSVGTGKTPGSIAAFENLKSKNKAKTSLVVAPAALKDNYLQNIRKFTDSKAVIIGNSQEAGKPDTSHALKIPDGHDYYIISNEMFRTNPKYYLSKTNADTVILDEMHKYKDPESVNYKQMMSVRPMFKNMIGLTGTPISNHPRDIVPQLDLITNKAHKLGKYEDFDKKFIQEKKRAYGPLAFFNIGPKGTETTVKNTKLLKNELNKYVHSYHQPDPDMPSKKVTNVDVPMSPEQADVYNWVMHKKINPITKFKVRYNLPVGKEEANNIFSALIQARQASNSLHLFKKDMSLEESAGKTPKVKKLLDDVHEHLNQNPSHKAIIYSNFINGGVDVVSAGLKQRGLDHGLYIGSSNTSLEERKQAVKDYLSGKIRTMVINSAGAEGLNLPGTTAHFNLDGHFNPAMIEQFEGRGIRSGSPVKEVEVRRYKTVMPNTAVENYFGKTFKPLKMIKGYSTDEWIYETARRKQEINDKVKELM